MASNLFSLFVPQEAEARCLVQASEPPERRLDAKAGKDGRRGEMRVRPHQNIRNRPPDCRCRDSFVQREARQAGVQGCLEREALDCYVAQ